MQETDGPLAGLRVLEIGGMGPGPFAGMTLADMGAEVVRIERPGGLGIFPGDPTLDVVNRGKLCVTLDLKRPEAVAALLTMAERADALIEGYRPGVAERLGIGPEQCWERNAALVYGRMTGWGQDGPLAAAAGHDISYIAITGALHAIGEVGGPPQVPVNLLGDYGGGGMYLVAGLLAALREADRTGRGQVVDAAIVDGTAHLLAGTHALLNTGTWRDERGVNTLDGGAPFYGVYETADGGHMAVGALEPKFYKALLDGLALTEESPEAQYDRAGWPELRERIAKAFRSRTRREWTEVFAGSDACVAPVLSLVEAASHPHVRTRQTVLDEDGFVQPAPAPRFSAHPQARPARPAPFGRDTRKVLDAWGVDPEPLLRSGAAAES
ncbi:alpha-methylacyl-CoA racemase [Haloechinothrix alba]|uniref:Alpha-methylacyl-CoA racemase n=1 Tax=Haloechinothrix alba TaxID=664784 RepID=A0A239A8Q9_9PSEU|nr:CaiB/BaiF CoA-transferase family protein [Haloechinothrix alba]SNR91997.1 alpha-methylacyl-CoA racemase [Haloechinothrix alba]